MQGGQGDWGVGLGLLSVYIDDLFKPIFVTPLNLDATLRLNRGRAWVGFTAATGEDTWQVGPAWRKIGWLVYLGQRV
jgi:hypothetical protein